MNFEFIKVLEQLQNLKFETDINEIIETSNKLEEKFKDVDFEEVAPRRLAKIKSKGK